MMQALFNALRQKNSSLVRSMIKFDKINLDNKYPKVGGKRTLHKIVYEDKSVSEEDLFDAIRQKNPSRVREIIKLNQLYLDYKNPKDEDQTALHVAASLGSLKIVKILVEEGHVRLGCTNKFGEFPECLAARNKHYDIVNYLNKLRLKRGLLLEAVKQKNSSLVRSLIKTNKSLVRFQYPGIELGRTILHVAAGVGSLEIVKILVEEGHASFSEVDENGELPKEEAARNGHVDIVYYLTKAGCTYDVDYYLDKILAKQAKCEQE